MFRLSTFKKIEIKCESARVCAEGDRDCRLWSIVYASLKYDCKVVPSATPPPPVRAAASVSVGVSGTR